MYRVLLESQTGSILFNIYKPNTILTPTIYLENKDCIDGLKKVKSHSIDAIVTDPPYFCGMTHNGTKGTFSDLAITKPFFYKVFKEFQRVLKPNGEVYIFCDWRTYALFYPLLTQIFAVRNRIT